jgi:hypothetical protein
VEGFYRRKAKALGVADGRGGAVTVIQRCGSALNVNPHFHVTALDGVFARAPGGELNFHAPESITDEDVKELLGTVRRRVRWESTAGADPQPLTRISTLCRTVG